MFATLDDVVADVVLREPPDPLDWVQPPSVMDVYADPDGTAAWAAGVTPGSDVVACLALLDAGTLSRAGLIGLLIGLQRQLSWLEALRHRTLAAVGDTAAETAAQVADPVHPDGQRWTQQDVACALRVSTHAAAGMLYDAGRLTGPLAPTLTLSEAGTISARHVWALTDTLADQPDDVCQAAHAEALTHAGDRTPAELRRIARAVAVANPTTIEAEHADASTTGP